MDVKFFTLSALLAAPLALNAAGTATPTLTVTPTSTRTVTTTRTAAAATNTPSPQVTATATPSPDWMATLVADSHTPTAFATASPVPTATFCPGQEIDNFEDGGLADLGTGTAWTLLQSGSNALGLGLSSPGAGPSAYALRVSGTSALDGIGGFRLGLAPGGVSVDLSTEDALLFDIKGNGCVVWVQFETDNITDDGYFGATVTAGAAWTTVVVPFTGVHQPSWAVSSSFTQGSVAGLRWVAVGAGAVDVSIDNVYLIKRCEGDPSSPTRTATPTLDWSPTPTLTPSATPVPALSGTAIASFEGSDLFIPQPSSAQGGTVVISVVPGCPYGSSGSACQASGVCSLAAGSASELLLSLAAPTNITAVEQPVRTLTFHVLAGTLPGQQLKVTVHTAYGDFSAVVSVPATGVWTDVTVAMPDDQAPGSLPQLQPDALVPPTQPWATAMQACTGIGIAPVAAGPFSFTVDDVRWGVAAGGASPAQVSAALGVSLADVQEAITYGLGDQATWILLILTKHCGCHPHAVIALRSTMSWGQIAVQEGTTWAAVLAEVDAAEQAAGLVPDAPSFDEMMRVLQNGPPTTAPLPTLTPYVPTGPIVLPAPGAC